VTPSGVRSFMVLRPVDPTDGLSGLGCVAVGALMPTGSVAMTWMTGVDSKTWFDDIDDLVLVHGHAGTRIMFDDDPDNPIEGVGP
jgi:hypothetical protein